MDIDDIKLIRPEKADTIIATFPRNETTENLRKLYKTLSELFPTNHVILLKEGISIEKMTADDLRQIGLKKIKESQ